MPGYLRPAAALAWRCSRRLLPPVLACAGLLGCGPQPGERAPLEGGDIERGRAALQQYACRTCHVIPGIAGSNVYVGPPLAGIGLRRTLAGELPNDRANLIRWIRFPQLVDPETAMPDMGVTERDARDMAAYLAKLK